MPQAEALVIVIVNRTRIGFSFFLWGKGVKTPGGGQKEGLWCVLVHSSASRWPALFMMRENSTNPLSMNIFSFFLPELFFNANLRIPQMLKHTIVILFITSEDRGSCTLTAPHRPFSCQQELPPCYYCLSAALKFTSGSVQIKMMLQMEVVMLLTHYSSECQWKVCSFRVQMCAKLNGHCKKKHNPENFLCLIEVNWWEYLRRHSNGLFPVAWKVLHLTPLP